MPSPRRKRFLVLAIVLTLLVIVYLTTGAKSTQSSPFYQKTVALMDSRKVQAQQGAEPLRERKLEKENKAQTEAEEQADATDRLKERLKEAEVAAKKSADNKWRNAADKAEIAGDAAKAEKPKAKAEKTAAAKVEEVSKQAAELTNERGIAGRRKYPAPADQGTSEDGIAHVGPQVDSAKVVAGGSAAERVEDETDPDVAAKAELGRILKRAPVVIFSKTYCPHSMKAKRILQQSYTITPAPFVVELDQHELGHELQSLLLEMTGRRTVPNVMVAGESIGGGDEMQELWVSGKMEETLKKVAGKLVKSVVANKEMHQDQVHR